MVAPSGGTFPYPMTLMTNSPLSGVGGRAKMGSYNQGLGAKTYSVSICVRPKFGHHAVPPSSLRIVDQSF